jgi:hypothetical protein
MRSLIGLCSVLGLILPGCGVESSTSAPPRASGKADTGWVSASTYEIDGLMRGTVSHEATGAWEDLATDPGLQEQLVEDQIKFGKNSLKKHHYHLDQLAQKITLESVEENEGVVTIRYAAEVDMTAENGDDEIPALEDLPELELGFPVPLDPVGVYSRAGESCAADWDPYVLYESNYYYYFAPDNEDCKVEMHQAKLTLTEVHRQKIAFPEYDQLMGDLGDGAKGFTAALMPGEARDRIKSHLEHDLNLEGEEVEGGSFTRYRMGDDKVAIVIDLYPSPYKIQEALGKYHLIYYHGHSNYGTNPYFTNKDAFAKHYQIFMVNSCRTYSYYARQILEQKATADDPKGWAAADVVANVEPNWISYSARTLKPLLQGLLEGMEAVERGEENKAPSWQSIIDKMEWMDSIRYGVAGVATNSWHPHDSEPTPTPP